ncbi:MAG: hypothetical protein LAT82_03095 [Nanoarchaeota archaeon]|nr:hypothetical protein [Nanoarchaeota archaeon]
MENKINNFKDKKNQKNNLNIIHNLKNQLVKLLKPTKVNIFLYLLLFYTIGAILFNLSNLSIMVSNLVSLLVLSGVGYALLYLFKLKVPEFNTFLISILIIFLILFPDTYSLELFLIHLFLIIGLFVVKYVRVKGKPIINPAVFAFIFAGLIALIVPNVSMVFMSWWGGAFGGYIGFFLLLPAVLYAGYVFKKWPTLVAFFITQSIILLFLKNIEFSIFSLTLFLAGIMLIELKTSPLKIYEQIVYGIGGAFLVSYTPSILLIDSHILAIAYANIIYFIYRELKPMLIKKIKS